MFDNKDSYTAKEYSRNKHIFKIIKLIIFATYFYLSILFINGIAKNLNNLFGIFFISTIAFFALKVVNSLNRENVGDRKRNYFTWGKGAGAEGVVGNQLSVLGQEYKIIPDFQNGHGNIDFIIVGPKGIFTIEVKAHSGNISCENNWIIKNGRKVDSDMIKQTRAEMFWITDFLKNKGLNFPVTSILEFPYGKIDTNSIHGQIDGIWIGGHLFHEYVICRSQQNLSTEQINLIADNLKKFTTV